MKAFTYGLWAIQFSFIGYAMYNWVQTPASSLTGPMVFVKYAVWAAFISFVAYSIYCSWKEKFFVSVRRIAALHWGRQVGIDLYLGLLLLVLVMFLHEQSILVVLIWLVPILLFGNIITLLYFATHFDAIVGRFL